MGIREAIAHGVITAQTRLLLQVCCSVLQCVAVCCSVCCSTPTLSNSVLQLPSVVVCCSVLQYVAARSLDRTMCCNTLQSVAVFYCCANSSHVAGVLHCVAVRCSAFTSSKVVLRCVAVCHCCIDSHPVAGVLQVCCRNIHLENTNALHVQGT